MKTLILCVSNFLHHSSGSSSSLPHCVDLQGCSWFISTEKSSSDFLLPQLGSLSSLVNELLILKSQKQEGDTFERQGESSAQSHYEVNVALVAKNKNFSVRGHLVQHVLSMYR